MDRCCSAQALAASPTLGLDSRSCVNEGREILELSSKVAMEVNYPATKKYITNTNVIMKEAKFSLNTAKTWLGYGVYALSAQYKVQN